MAELRGGLNGKLGLTTGTVYSNFFLDSVEMIIVDSDGQEVFNKRMFTTVSKLYDDSNHLDLVIRQNNHEYDLGHFAVPFAPVFQARLYGSLLFNAYTTPILHLYKI